MKVSAIEFLEPVRNVNAGQRSEGEMMTKWKDGGEGAKEACRVFGPGVLIERTDGSGDVVVVPWGNVRWARVNAEELKGAKR
jgi:hypothetical protein